MPNTPVVVRSGMTIYSMGQAVNEQDEMIVDQLLSSVGVAHQMDEYYMDIVTGLTGCGPSYVSTGTIPLIGYPIPLFSSV